MAKQILILIGAIALTTTNGAIAQHIHDEHEQEYEHESAAKYTCPMHPEVVTDHPGNCPKCGMKLVPIKAKTHETHTTHTSNGSNGSHRPMSMQSSVNIADPMNRESSGTAWVPDSTPMYGKMFMFGDDMLMLHGGIFPRYTNVSTRRGDDRIDAPNWIMAMYSHPFSDSTQIGGRLMMSLDPLTE